MRLTLEAIGMGKAKLAGLTSFAPRLSSPRTSEDTTHRLGRAVQEGQELGLGEGRQRLQSGDDIHGRRAGYSLSRSSESLQAFEQDGALVVAASVQFDPNDYTSSQRRHAAG